MAGVGAQTEEGLASYRQYEQIGCGAFSAVFKARKRQSIEAVALRRVHMCRQEKLLAEVRALREMSHPNLLALHGWYKTDNHFWVVCEYCPGGDLAAVIAHDGAYRIAHLSVILLLSPPLPRPPPHSGLRGSTHMLSLRRRSPEAKSASVAAIVRRGVACSLHASDAPSDDRLLVLSEEVDERRRVVIGH